MSAFQADQTTLTQPRQVSTQSSMVLPELGANASQPFELTMTPAQFGLTAFGAYPLAVEVVQWDAVQLASQRTFLTYAPPTPQPPVRNRLAFVLPIIDQPHRADEGTFVDAKLSAAMTGKGRLATLARIAEAAPPSVTWVIDPAVFDDADAMAKEHTLSTKGAKQKRPADNAASQWLTSVRTSLADNPVMATPYADPDVTALAHQGLDDQTGLALELGAQKARQLVKPDVGTSTYWPAGGRLDADALDLLAVGKPNVAKVDKVLLDAANLPPQTPATTTPDAATTIDTVMGPITALTADAELSRTLGGALGHRRLDAAEQAAVHRGDRHDLRRARPDPAQITRHRPLPALEPQPDAGDDAAQDGRQAAVAETDPARLDQAGHDPGAAGGTHLHRPGPQAGARRQIPRPRQGDRRQGAADRAGHAARPQPEFDAAVLRLTSSAWRGGTAGRACHRQAGRRRGHGQDQQGRRSRVPAPTARAPSPAATATCRSA